jgi:glycosyltransferase involved in cell wall biosynthesis
MANNLFIGSFLSSSKGSLSVSELVAQNLKHEGITTKLVSFFQNKLLRILDILFNVLFFRGKKIHIEVYSGQAFRIAELSMLVASFKKSKTILTLHGGKLPQFYQQYPVRVSKLLNKAHTIATPSLYIKHFFESLGFTLTYIPNSIPLENFPFKRDQVKPFSLLWVRAFSEIYNPLLAIKTLAILHKKYPESSLTMVGPDGGLLANAKQLVLSLGLEHAVNFIGPLPNHELKSYYQTHEVFLNTTSYESFGVAVIEAASCGIPMVSSSVGEIPHLWHHNKNALLVNTFEESDFSKEIIKLFADRAFANQLALAARQNAQKFSWSSINQQWVALLNA